MHSIKIASDKIAFKILMNSGEAPPEGLEKAYKEAESTGRPFIQVLQEAGILGEEAILSSFSKALGRPVVNLKTAPPDPAVFQYVPVKFASYYKFFPIRKKAGKLLIATSRILDIHALDEIRFALGSEIEICFAAEKDIDEMIKRYYGLAAETVDKILSETPASERSVAPGRSQEVEDLEELASAPSVARVVNQIILDAFQKGASDIHLEPLSSGIRLRYRIDGILQEAPVPRELKDFFSPMLSRIKIMANLNVAEKRLPQDGKMRVKTQEETLDLRVSFIPTAHGESVVVRILPGKNVFRLEQLGFEPAKQKIIEEVLKRPNGLFFVTGPTGSGKSTTLYAALNRLNSPERKIITIEDPVEYELEGINQIHVNPEIGLSFSNGLRSMLRQDPDIMMVGEVRDFETAEIAIQSALTGHLILSTLHTNDAASGVTRLLDIGVEPYLVASSVIAFMGQRLVRVICSHCKEESTQVAPAIAALIEKECGATGQGVKIFRGRGCDRCNGTGYRGRVAIHELLVLNERIRQLITTRATSDVIKAEAVRQGMVTLRQDGWTKVIAGVTTPEEILEATEHESASSGTGSMDRRELPAGPEAFPGELQARYDDDAGPSGGRSGAIPETSGTSEKDFINLRKYKRITCHLPVFYRLVHYKGSSAKIQKLKDKLATFDFEGFTENLSAGGVLFKIYDQKLSPEITGSTALTIGETLEGGEILDFLIHLPDQDNPVECVVKVLRIVRSQQVKVPLVKADRLLSVATLFLAIDSVDRTRLERFCQTHRAPDDAI
ncbi:MAG: Flp pilus assembly complex ATPase component TadA [Candidatus Omnitrophica bacterium]|nr:Flp pilus assembly complex ATPase component TadA [Candidatus Omnitrophota bacterium]